MTKSILKAMLPMAPQTEALTYPHLSELWRQRKGHTTYGVFLPGGTREGPALSTSLGL